jgi:hypothetical protein
MGSTSGTLAALTMVVSLSACKYHVLASYPFLNAIIVSFPLQRGKVSLMGIILL